MSKYLYTQSIPSMFAQTSKKSQFSVALPWFFASKG